MTKKYKPISPDDQQTIGDVTLQDSIQPTVTQGAGSPLEIVEAKKKYILLDVDSHKPTTDITGAEIGRGGFGRVILAYDQSVGREIALKQLLPEAKAEALQRFLREVRVTGQLEHPNIIPVYELGQHKDGSFYYTMKLVRGRTLADALKEAKNLQERLKLLKHFIDVCNAIAYAHSRGVVHRDIKTRNIMIGEFGETVILDWGIAKVAGLDEIKRDNRLNQIVDDSVSYTVAGDVIGTPKYMSPEQASGAGEVDQRSDVWSLGAVLYEILTGQPPFSSMDNMAALNTTKARAVTPVQEVCPEAVSELAAVAEKALKFKKEERYQNAKELADEIDAYRSGLRVTAYDYSSWELIKRVIEKNRRLSIVIAVSILSLLVALGLIVRAYNRAEVARRHEYRARVEAQTNERMANRSLATAYHEKAIRELAEKDYLSALLYSASALVFNPNNRPDSETLLEDVSPEEQALEKFQLTMQRSIFYQAYVNRPLTYIASLAGHTDSVAELAFSSDSSLIASAGNDKTIRLWSIAARKQIALLTGHTDYIFALSLSPDGQYLASAGRDKTIHLWNLLNNSPVNTVLPNAGEIYTLDLSSEGDLLAAGCQNGSVLLFSFPDLKELAAFSGHTNSVLAARFSPDGKTLASGSTDGTIRLWSTATRKEEAKLTGHEGPVRAVSFSPDGLTLASGSSDQTVRCWNLATRKSLATLRSHSDWVWEVKFSPDGQILASSSRDKAIKFWDMQSFELLTTLKRPTGVQQPIAFSPNGNYFLSSEGNYKISLWAFPEKQMLTSLRGSPNVVLSPTFSPDGALLAAGTWDMTLLWDMTRKQLAAKFDEPKNLVRSATFSPDGKILATAGVDRIIRFYSPSTKTLLGKLTGHLDVVFALAFSPDGTLLASGSRDNTIKMWNVSTMTLIDTMRGHEDDVLSIAFSPDGKTLVSGGKDKNIILWDVAKRQKIRSLTGHENWVAYLAFSNDGSRLISTGKDALIKIWDTSSYSQIRTLTGHTNWVNEARFSPNGKMIITGSDDRSLRIWDAETGSLLLLFSLGSELSAASFSPDGNQFIYNDGNTIIMLPLLLDTMNVNPPLLLTDAENWAGMKIDPGTFKQIDFDTTSRQ